MELVYAIIAGAIGGGLVLGIEQILIHLKEKRKESRHKLVSFPNPVRIIDVAIFDRLAPGRGVDLMRAVLGTPDNTFIDETPIFESHREEETGLIVYRFESDEDKAAFEEKRFHTNAFLYDFQNAIVKITSKDKSTISSLAVEVKDGFNLNISQLPLGFDTEDELPGSLGLIKVNKTLVDTSRAAYEFSRFDKYFVLSVYTAAPFYTHYSYFGYPDNDVIDISADNPDTFIGCTIQGVCLHRDEFDCYIPRGWDFL
jgi:hypothetical protein